MFFRAHGNIENKEPTGFGAAMLAPIGRNRIINGDFSVNQRGFTSTTTANTYGFDRWQIGCVGGTTTHSTQAPSLGEFPESAKAYARVVTSGQSAAGDYAQLVHKIESVRSLSGKTVTVSFWARASSGTPKVAVSAMQYYGTGGSPSSWIDTHVGKVTLSTVLTRYSLTFDNPSIAGKTLGSNNDDALWFQFWTSSGSTYAARSGSIGIQNVTIDFWGVQVEEGPYATAFEQKTYAQELRDCQRYYVRFPSTAYIGMGTNWTTTNCAGLIPLPAPMRIVPTPGYSAIGTMYLLTTGTNIALTGITTTSMTPSACRFDATVTSGLSSGGGSMLFTDNYFHLSAEF